VGRALKLADASPRSVLSAPVLAVSTSPRISRRAATSRRSNSASDARASRRTAIIAYRTSSGVNSTSHGTCTWYARGWCGSSFS
jgi:hypothetical protein